MSGKTFSRSRGRDAVSREGLAARRRRARRWRLIAFLILALLLVGASLWALWQPQMRISRVAVEGGDPSLATYASTAMEGTYLGIVPRDSTLLYPESRIRANLLADHPEIAAVSIAHAGLTGLTIRPTVRTPVARWCGLSPTPDVPEYCYVFDGSGFIYAALPEVIGSSTVPSARTVNGFRLYAPLADQTEEPLRATIEAAAALPHAFEFARKLAAFGSPVSAVVLHDGEADDLLSSGTRVTYVLGEEEDAFTALRSAARNFSLADGSVEYVDLRFPGKVYVKRVESAE